MRMKGLVAELIVVTAVSSAPATAQIQFTENGAARGIGAYTAPFGHGGGVILADYDDDGDVDIFVPNGNGVADQLYRNLGGGTFEEIADDVGLADTAQSRTAVWLDYDGDDDLDLVVARDAFGGLAQPATTLVLYRQEAEGVFVDATVEAGLFANLLTGQTHIGGLCAGDVNGDGRLDLFMSQWKGAAFLFTNDGGGTFTDVSVASGLAASSETQWQSIMHDFDGDGHLDIFMAVDFLANHLWMNQGDGTFLDRAATAGVDFDFNEMGVALGDYDNDGDLDLYTTNISREKSQTGRYSVLYRNDSTPGVPLFMDVAEDLGVQHIGWGWGVTFPDVDRDGWVDLAITNGFINPEYVADPSKLFLNPGAAATPFIEVSDTVGFNDTHWGSAVVAFDMDRDGDLDLAQSCNLGAGLRLLESSDTGATGGYLVVKPRMTGSNRRAIGAVVRATADGVTMMRLITAGTSFLGQEPAEAFFGIGDATTVDVRVEWPDGRVSVVDDLPADTVQEITDDTAVVTCLGDVDADGAVDFGDLTQLLAAWGPCPGWCAADLDRSAAVAFGDLTALLQNWGPCS